MAVEVVIKVGVQFLFWVGGGGWVVDYTKSILISAKVEVVVEVGFEKFLILNFYGRLMLVVCWRGAGSCGI